MEQEVREKEVVIQTLKNRREQIKEVSGNVVEQNRLMEQLKVLLEEKLRNKKKVKNVTTSTLRNDKQQFNRAVID